MGVSLFRKLEVPAYEYNSVQCVPLDAELHMSKHHGIVGAYCTQYNTPYIGNTSTHGEKEANLIE